MKKIIIDTRVREEYVQGFQSYYKNGYKVTCSPLFKDYCLTYLDYLINPESNVINIHKQKANIVFEKDIFWNNPFNITKIITKKCIFRLKVQRIFSPFKRSKSARSFLTASHLIKSKLDTPIPLAVIDKRKFGFVSECYYVSEGLIPHDKVRKLVRTPETDPKLIGRLITAVSSYTNKMHDSGMLHNDLNLANFILYKKDDLERVALIDLNRATFYRKELTKPARLKDISRLSWKKYKQEFLQKYTQNDPAYKKWMWIFNHNKKLRSKKKRMKRKLEAKNAGNY